MPGLRRTLDVNNNHCTKVYLCKSTDPYESAYPVELTNAEFVMGDIPVTATKLLFTASSIQANRLFVLAQNARISHINLLLTGSIDVAETYIFKLYVIYPGDLTTEKYLITPTTLTLNSTNLSGILTVGNNSLAVFPENSMIEVSVITSGGSGIADIHAYLVTVPAVV